MRIAIARVYVHDTAERRAYLIFAVAVEHEFGGHPRRARVLPFPLTLKIRRAVAAVVFEKIPVGSQYVRLNKERVARRGFNIFQSAGQSVESAGVRRAAPCERILASYYHGYLFARLKPFDFDRHKFARRQIQSRCVCRTIKRIERYLFFLRRYSRRVPRRIARRRKDAF